MRTIKRQYAVDGVVYTLYSDNTTEEHAEANRFPQKKFVTPTKNSSAMECLMFARQVLNRANRYL